MEISRYTIDANYEGSLRVEFGDMLPEYVNRFASSATNSDRAFVDDLEYWEEDFEVTHMNEADASELFEVAPRDLREGEVYWIVTAPGYKRVINGTDAARELSKTLYNAALHGTEGNGMQTEDQKKCGECMFFEAPGVDSTGIKNMCEFHKGLVNPNRANKPRTTVECGDHFKAVAAL